MIEQGINQLLSADAGFAGVVGQCLYPVQLPEQPSYPCASYQVVSARSDYSLDGAAERWIRLQLDAWGNTYADCKAVISAADKVLDGFQGALSEGTWVLGTFRDVELNFTEQYSRVFRTSVEYTIHFRPS